jgi:hypothetical protein
MAHCVTLMHVVLQLVAFAQEKPFEHAAGAPPAQLPMPSHCVLVVSIEPMHDVSEHGVPASYIWQVPVPSAHLPLVPHGP